MAIPTQAQWLEETSRNIFRPRSPELRLVDQAIGQYERSKTPAALGKIKITFEAWKRTKGPGWVNNERNHHGGRSNTKILSNNIAENERYCS